MPRGSSAVSLLLNTPHSRSVVPPISFTMPHRPMIWQGQSPPLAISILSTSSSVWEPTSSLGTRDFVVLSSATSPVTSGSWAIVDSGSRAELSWRNSYRSQSHATSADSSTTSVSRARLAAPYGGTSASCLLPQLVSGRSSPLNY